MHKLIEKIIAKTNINDQIITNAIKSGLKYYINEQFSNEGVSLWRVPQQYPIEIHNQAQGIITCALLKEYGEQHLNFAGVGGLHTDKLKRLLRLED